MRIQQWLISTIDSADAGMGVDIELNQNETSVFAYMSGNFLKLYNEETGFHSKTVKGYASVYGKIEFEIDSQDRAFDYFSNRFLCICRRSILHQFRYDWR